MKNEDLTLTSIKDYILEYYPDLLWWDGTNKHETWNPERFYKHRQGMPNEIRIEFDSDDKESNWANINLTAVNLWNAGYSFAIFYVEGGRSPHIHIYDIDEMSVVFKEKEQRSEYRNKFLNKFCPPGSNPDKALSDEKHLCALEFANHFKYDKPKQLLSIFWQGKNMACETDILFDKMDYPFFKTKPVLKKNITKPLKFGDLLKKNTRDLIIQNLTFEKVLDKYGVKYRGHMAICPFHSDTNGSLSFSNQKGLWKCFGCEEKGDIITLIKRLKEVKNGRN